MKKIVLLIFTLLIIIVSCDKVKNPDQRPPQVYHCIDTLHQVIKTLVHTSTTNQRNVLIEDYTGHKCPNCPRAGITAEKLLEQYPGRVVVIANHVTGIYADPSRDSTDKYKENFRNPASDEWDTKDKGFSISGAGLPQGMINRISNPYFPQSDTKWPSLVSVALTQPALAKLDIKTYYDTISHYLSVKVKTTFLNALTNNVNVIIVLTQDGIIGSQKDGNASNAPLDRDPLDPQTRLNYKFDHIVIDAINGPQGQLMKAAPIVMNDTASVFTSCYLLNKCFGKNTTTETIPPYTAICVNDKLVNLVAFIVDAQTKEVLQVETLKIR